MPSKENGPAKSAAKSTPKATTTRPRATKPPKEPIINVVLPDALPPEDIAINPGRRTKTMDSSRPATAESITITRTTGKDKLEATGPAGRRNSSRTRTAPPADFHNTDKLPPISPGTRQEIYAIILVTLGLVAFFAMFSSGEWIAADAARFIKRMIGGAAYILPFLFVGIGITFFIEGLQRREYINQTRLLGGIISILAFFCLVHLFSPDPFKLADSGGGGGYLGYYVTLGLQKIVTPPGTFFVLLALLLVGLLIAFNVTLRQVGSRLRNFYLYSSGRYVKPSELPLDDAPPPSTRFDFEDENDDDDLDSNGRPYTHTFKLNRPEKSVLSEDDDLLDDLLSGNGPPPVQNSRPVNVPPPAATEEKEVAALPAAPTVQQWQRDEPLANHIASELPHKEWIVPKINMLASFSDVEVNEKELKKNARLIEETLMSFGVEAYVREVNTGPTVTQYALEPGFGVKVSRITALVNDLALALAAPSVRIEAPVPGQSRVGIEVPNLKVATVGMREIMESEDYTRKKGALKFALGRNVAGTPVIADLARMPHLLIAGSTGSGKSVCLNAVVAAFLFQYRPDELQFIMVDPKMVELSTYNGIPHLRFPVVTQIESDPDKERERNRTGDRTPTVMSVLKWTIREMERRYKYLSNTGHRNIESYNKIAGVGNAWEKMPYLVFIIDELADLMMVAPDEAEAGICRLAQKARAVGIHLILATQRPSVDVVTGLIKANFPSRIAFAVTSQTDSRVILDSVGAERLLGRGDMLFQSGDSAKPMRAQGVFVADGEIDALVKFWRKQNDFLKGSKSDFVQNQFWPQELREIEAERDLADNDDETDELFDQALEIVREGKSASVSLLQRRLRVGYNRAARLIEELEKAGVIGHAEGSRPRPVLLEDEDLRPKPGTYDPMLEPPDAEAIRRANTGFYTTPREAAETERAEAQPPSPLPTNGVRPIADKPAFNAQARRNRDRATDYELAALDRAEQSNGYDEDDDPPL